MFFDNLYCPKVYVNNKKKIKEKIHYLFEKSLEAKHTFPYVIVVMHLLSISSGFLILQDILDLFYRESVLLNISYAKIRYVKEKQKF